MIHIRTLNQKRYLDLLSTSTVVVATGPAGTGKTLLACHAASKALVRGDVRKIVLTRPAVSVDEEHGHLPGSLDKKMSPWVRPMIDALEWNYKPKQIREMMSDSVIEVCPLAFMRGRTFDNSWIIADEMQNTTPNQMKMILTRLGHGSKMVITGDPDQCERGFIYNGLIDLLSRFDPEVIKHIQFHSDDIERNPIIKDILNMYSR